MTTAQAMREAKAASKKANAPYAVVTMDCRDERRRSVLRLRHTKCIEFEVFAGVIEQVVYPDADVE